MPYPGIIIQENLDKDVVPNEGKKKAPDTSLFNEVEKIPKRSKSGPPDISVGDMLMDMELFKNKYSKVWMFGEGSYRFVSIFNIERRDTTCNK